MREKRLIDFIYVAFACFLVLAVACVFPANSSAQSKSEVKVYKWRMPGFLPRGTDAEKIREQWCKDMTVVTQGRIEIQYFGAGEILPATQIWDAIANGVVDIAFSYGAYWRGKTPLSLYSEGLPYTAPDLSDLKALFYEYGIEDIIRKAYAQQGVHLLRPIPAFYTTMIGKFPVTSVDDLRKKKVRAGGPIAEMLKAGGIPTVYMQTVEVYSALERGAIDCAIGGPISYMYDMGFHEVAKYILLPGTGPEADEILMNPKTWQSLPKDLQMILYNSAGELSHKIEANYWARDRKLLRTMIDKHGVKTTTLPEAEQKKMAGYTIKAAESISQGNPEFTEATNELKQYLKLLGRMD